VTKMDILNKKLDLLFKCVYLGAVSTKVPDACRFMLNQHHDKYLELQRDWENLFTDGEWTATFGGVHGKEKPC